MPDYTSQLDQDVFLDDGERFEAAREKCAMQGDAIDYRAMLARVKRTLRAYHWGIERGLPARIVNAELSAFEFGTSYREMCERGY